MNLNYTLILGSKSPRRQKLLKEAGYPFKVKSIDIEENFPEDIPLTDLAKYLAEKKALKLRDDLQDEVLLTADTIVKIGTQVLGKPANLHEAKEMLKKLSNKTHEVITGVCICNKEKLKLFDDVTYVTFKELSDKEINYYLENYRPIDKAGAYGIQEWLGMIGVTKIEGSYFNVMGLPVYKIYEQLKSF